MRVLDLQLYEGTATVSINQNIYTTQGIQMYLTDPWQQQRTVIEIEAEEQSQKVAIKDTLTVTYKAIYNQTSFH